MWFTAVDIASTPGGHAGMQRSHPLQCSTSMVTVPRLLMVLVASGMRRAPLPRGIRAGGEETPARGDGPLVGFDVLRPVRRYRLAHPFDERVTFDDPRRRGVGAEHHQGTAQWVTEVG